MNLFCKGKAVLSIRSFLFEVILETRLHSFAQFAQLYSTHEMTR